MILGRVWKDDRDSERSAAKALSQTRKRDRLRCKPEQREATSKGSDLKAVRLKAQADSKQLDKLSRHVKKTELKYRGEADESQRRRRS